jgi:hypothetical protein
MRHALISVLLILAISCKTKTNNWQTLDFGSFKMKAPHGWKIFKEKGIDSYVGGLTNGVDSLWFDFGWYSPDIGDEDPKKHKFGQDTINGLIARLVIPVTPGDGYIGMFIPVNREDKFSIMGQNVQNTDTILKMFKTIVFKESDTSINSRLKIDKFKSYPNGTGKTLFQQNCASCHSLTKEIVGPSVQVQMHGKTSDWLYKFVTHRKLVANDSTYQNLKKKYNNLECLQFPNLTKEDVDQIAQYIQSN